MVHPTRRVERPSLEVDVAEPVQAMITGAGERMFRRAGRGQGRGASALLRRQATAVLAAVLRTGCIPSWPRRGRKGRHFFYEKYTPRLEGGRKTKGLSEEGEG